MDTNTVWVLSASYQGCSNGVSVYSSREKLWEAEKDSICEELNAEQELTGDFEQDWNYLVGLMSESESSYDISECVIDGDTLSTI